jgi:Sulfotransferase family
MQQLATAVRDLTSAECSTSDPVFVLCNGRSGSTLLRFLLDAHPELACPPEMNLPSLCVQLASVWSLIEGARLAAGRGDDPPEIPEAAIAGIRTTMDQMVGTYLTRRSKKRYCDKSLGTARYAGLLTRVYPAAKFICLYRHPMDVIASGMEACPWGLNGYGFDPYIATTPGNTVLALSRYWADNVGIIVAAEEQFADRCLRVRYEDMVSDAEGTAASIFDFLEVRPAPGISQDCFSPDRERFGPADHKIWYTSTVSTESIGRGWSVPSAMITLPVLDAINDLTARLGYLPVDSGWGTSAPPADLRIPMPPPDGKAAEYPAQYTDSDACPRLVASPCEAASDLAPGEIADSHQPSGQISSKVLGHRLRASLERLSPETISKWAPWQADKFVAIWVPEDGHTGTQHWLVRLDERTVQYTDQAAQQESDWDVIGNADTWLKILSGKLNLSVALRACQVRYCDGADGGPECADIRMRILAELLALAAW